MEQIEKIPQSDIRLRNQSGELTSKGIDSLQDIERIHYTNPAAAVRCLTQGIFSSDFAFRTNNSDVPENRYQGSRSVSVSSLKAFAEDNQLDYEETILEALGQNGGNRFFHDGGICFVINSSVELSANPSSGYRNSRTGTGGMPAEEVAAIRIAPRKLDAVIFTNYADDSYLDCPLAQYLIEPRQVADSINIYRAFVKNDENFNDLLAKYNHVDQQKLLTRPNEVSFPSLMVRSILSKTLDELVEDDIDRLPEIVQEYIKEIGEARIAVEYDGGAAQNGLLSYISEKLKLYFSDAGIDTDQFTIKDLIVWTATRQGIKTYNSDLEQIN